jgi:hypothetical protein
MFRSVSEPALDQAMGTICILCPFRFAVEAAILFRGAEPVALGQGAVALLRVLVERQRVPPPGMRSSKPHGPASPSREQSHGPNLQISDPGLVL